MNMKSLLSFFTQFRASWPVIGLILAVSGVLIGAGLVLHFWAGIPIGELTRDPTSIAKDPPYTGYLSQIGNFFWAASAAVCLFSAKVLSGSLDHLKIKHFLIVSGILTLVLGLDDLFLLHEVFFPHFGIPQNIILVSYAGLGLFYLVRFYSIILKTEYILLGMAVFFFGISITLDLFHAQEIDPYLFEDGSKLVGIISWLGYFFRTGVSTVSDNIT